MGSHAAPTKKKSTEHRGVPGVRVLTHESGMKEKMFIPAIAEGLATTFRHFFKNTFSKEKYTLTIQYPDEKVEYPKRFRGMHRLVPREDGTSRCVACYMCQTACPARCINIVAGETDNGKIEKYPVVFEIDELRCVMCGLCVEACPCDAIRMDTGIHPKPVYSREDADFGKADLLGILSREEAKSGQRDTTTAPPPTAAGTGRVDRNSGDGGAGGAAGGYEVPKDQRHAHH